MPELKHAECIPKRNTALDLAGTTRHCAAGEWCVCHAALGTPARLSRGNPGPRCFACEEHHAAATLGKAAKQAKAAVGRKDSRRPSAESGEHRGAGRKGPVCARGSCERRAVEWLKGVRVCGEHAEASRARERQEECSRRAQSCDAALRSALSAGDETLARELSGMLEETKGRLALAEANLAAAEARAHPKPKVPRFAV